MKVVAGLGLVVSFWLQIGLNISKCENAVCLGFQRLFKIVAMSAMLVTIRRKKTNFEASCGLH